MNIDYMLKLEMQAFLFSLAATVVLGLLTGRINTSMLLCTKDGSGRISPQRVQLMIATFITALQYLNLSLQSTSGTLPDLPNEFLYLIGGSSGIYSVHKFTSYVGTKYLKN